MSFDVAMAEDEAQEPQVGLAREEAMLTHILGLLEEFLKRSIVFRLVMYIFR